MFRDYVNLPRTVHLLCFGSFLNRAGSFVLIFLTIYLSRELRLGISFATFSIGILGLGSIVASLAGGVLADRIGRKRVMLLALLGGAVLLVLLSLCRHPATIMACLFVFALVNDLYRPAASAMIGDLVPFRTRPHAFSLMYTAVNLGFACAPPIGGLLIEISYAWLFWADAGTMALYAVIIAALVPATLHLGNSSESPNKSEGSNRGADAAADELENPALPLPGPSVESRVVQQSRRLTLGETAKAVAADRSFLVFCLCTFLVAMIFLQGFSTLPLYVESLGYSASEFGRLIAINGLLIVLLQLPATHLLRNYNRMRIITIGAVLVGSGFFLTQFMTAAWGLALAIVIWTLGEIAQAIFKNAIVVDLAPPELRASYLGLFSMCFAVAITIGAPLGGLVLEFYGAAALWNSAAMIAAIAALLYLTVGAETNERIRPAARHSVPADA